MQLPRACPAHRAPSLSYIALLDRSGATLKEAMQLARHSDPKLTMAVYGRAQMHDLAGVVGRLPSLGTDRGGNEAHRLAATGTDSSLGAESLRQACAQADAGCVPLMVADSS